MGKSKPITDIELLNERLAEQVRNLMAEESRLRVQNYLMREWIVSHGGKLSDILTYLRHEEEA